MSMTLFCPFHLTHIHSRLYPPSACHGRGFGTLCLSPEYIQLLSATNGSNCPTVFSVAVSINCFPPWENVQSILGSFERIILKVNVWHLSDHTDSSQLTFLQFVHRRPRAYTSVCLQPTCRLPRFPFSLTSTIFWFKLLLNICKWSQFLWEETFMLCSISSETSEPRLWRWCGDNGSLVTERCTRFRAQGWVHRVSIDKSPWPAFLHMKPLSCKTG